MYTFPTGELIKAKRHLMMIWTSRLENPEEPNCPASVSDLKFINDYLPCLIAVAAPSALDLPELLGRCELLKVKIDIGSWIFQPPIAEVIGHELSGILHALDKELGEKKFHYVDKSKTEYFENPALFGPKVNKVFPAAIDDIKQAGNCIAFDLNTAAVFHLMRVVEFGLRSLAENLAVIVPEKDIQYSRWNTIIECAYGKIKTLKEAARGTPGKAEMLEDYSKILTEFSYFKDKFRNAVMHTRADYDEHEGLSTFNHVREFMAKLADMVSTSQEESVSSHRPK